MQTQDKTPPKIKDVEDEARRFRFGLGPYSRVGRHEALQIVAKRHGYSGWAGLKAAAAEHEATTPS